MRTRMSRLALAAGAVGLSLTLFAGPASAGQPKQSLGTAGSDTTYFMMNLIASHYNGEHGEHEPRHHHADPAGRTPAPFPASVTVPADGVHPAMTWDSSSPAATPPNGSSAGITALQQRHDGPDRVRTVVAWTEPG